MISLPGMKKNNMAAKYILLALKVILYQSSQVDLLAKSEICNGAAVVCDTAGVTPLGGSGSMFPPEILENGSS